MRPWRSRRSLAWRVHWPWGEGWRQCRNGHGPVFALLDRLNASGVECVVVGGAAAVLHGAHWLEIGAWSEEDRAPLPPFDAVPLEVRAWWLNESTEG